MSTKEIIDSILEHEGISASSFAKEIGIHPTQIYDLQSGKTKKISATVGNKIISVYPNYNLQWLLTGEGEMLKSESETDRNKALTKEQYYEDDIPEQFTTYLVPMAAMGGSLVGFEDEGVRKENCERVISPVANADWVIPVCGDSMEPEYPNGSRVYVQQIYPDDFIAWGNVFVLDTTNGIIIKVVKESEKKGYVRCESLNPSGRYTPFDVPMRSIRAMYRVLLCVSVK